MKPVRWHPLALEDLYEAAETYKGQRDGRDERFLDAVSRTIELVRRFPLIGKPVDEERRGLLVHRFPYSVIYRPLPERLEVIAIAHHKRGDALWYRR